MADLFDLHSVLEDLVYSVATGEHVKIVLKIGLGLKYDECRKYMTITFPKLEMGMLGHSLECMIYDEDDESDWCNRFEKEEFVNFRTKDGYTFSLKYGYIESCDLIKC